LKIRETLSQGAINANAKASNLNGTALQTKIVFKIEISPTDGTKLPINGSGDFGALPFLKQLSGKQSA
jgi:hypothetical protein